MPENVGVPIGRGTEAAPTLGFLHWDSYIGKDGSAAADFQCVAADTVPAVLRDSDAGVAAAATPMHRW
jgi:hypothetical protein